MASNSADESNATDSLDTIVANLIETLVSTREMFQAELTDMQNSQEERDYESRHADQAGLVTTKNNLWKDMSWIVRQSNSGGNNSAGLSAGPVMGFLNQFAQV